MDSFLDELKKEEEFYSELRRLSQPGFLDNPKEAEELQTQIVPMLYEKPSLLDDLDQETKDGIFLAIVGEPLRRTFVFWLGSIEPIGSTVLTEKDKVFLESVTEPHNSKELFNLLEKMGGAPFGRQYCYKISRLNPALQTRVEHAITEKNFEAFEQILLEHYDQIKTFLCIVIQLQGLTNLKELGDITLTNEQVKILQKRISRQLTPFNQSDDAGLISRIQRVLSILQFNEDTPIKEIIGWYKEYYRLVATGYLSGVFGLVSDTEKEIFERLINNPLFPEIYNECKQEAETMKASLNQGALGEDTTPKDTPPAYQPNAQPVDLDLGRREKSERNENDPTFSLPRDERWKKCQFFNTKEHQHYIMTSLQSARMVRQDQIESLFNSLVKVGCLDNKEDVLLALAVRLTGRKLMPEPIPPIEWLGEESELDYLIYRLTPAEQKPSYSRYKHFFKDYNPSGAARRTAKGMVRPEVIAELDKILPRKMRPDV